MGKEQEVESLSIRMSIDTAGVIAGLTAVNNLFNKITANAFATTAEINRMLAALGQLSGVEHGGIGVGRPGEYSPGKPTQPNDPPGEYSPVKPTQPNDPPGSPAPDIPKPTPEPTQPTPTTGQPTQPTVLPRRTTGQRLDYTTRRWVNRIKRLVMPLVAAFGARALWKGFNDGVKMIDTYRKQIGMSTSELDKWAKANQYAGGSQKALLDTMAKFVKETGQSADDFIEMMLHFNELSEAEQEAFLKTKGYSEEAVAIFKKSDADIVNILSVTKDMAFTDKDIKTVKGFNEQWERFKVLSQGIGNILIRYVQPVLTSILKLVNGIGDWAVKHQGTLKVLVGLLSVAFGGAFLRQLKAGAGAGGIFVNVIKALTSGVLKFGKVLLASPLTWFIAALAGIYLVIEDLWYFAQGKGSVTGKVLEQFFGKDTVEWIRSEIKEVFDLFDDFVDMCGDLWKEYGTDFKRFLKGIVYALKFVVGTVIALIGLLIAGFFKLGQYIGKAIGYLVVNIPKWWETIVNAVKGWWEDLKQGASDIWNGIKDVISGVIDEIVKIFENMWKSACEYVDKSIDKLKELNPFQDFGESLGSKLYTLINGDNTANVVGAHNLPVTAGNKNITTTQNNTFNINAKDSVEGAEKGLKQAQNKFAQPSYVGLVN